ncbi:hypothetical protein FOXYSP1_06760 [Fusarium oxysporum f. sp. phaseoli]
MLVVSSLNVIRRAGLFSANSNLFETFPISVKCRGGVIF